MKIENGDVKKGFFWGFLGFELVMMIDECEV